MTRPLVIIGDALLDVDVDGTSERLCPDAPAPVVDHRREQARPGGAGLAALLAAADGFQTALVAPLGEDDAGRRLATMLSPHVHLAPLRISGTTPAKVRIRADGQTLVRLDSGNGHAVDGPVAPAVTDMLRSAGAVLVADYGRGTAQHATIRQLLSDLPLGIPVVWDPHPKGAQPLPGCYLATPNQGEAETWARRSGAEPAPAAGACGLAAAARSARHLARAWRAHAVAVTLGSRGALLSAGEPVPLMVPPDDGHGVMAAADTCGAGDRFAVTAAGVLADGGTPAEAVTEGVSSASRYISDGGAAEVAARLGLGPGGDKQSLGPGGSKRSLGAGPAAGRRPRQRDSAHDVVERTRRRGGVVVATGGCFDLLHAGHVRLLRHARALGDCLVVCLNSDASVRRLKGPGRPVVGQHDRARVLQALADVDAVAIFDEDTPTSIISRLAPDIWVKGADHHGADLPEDEAVRACGGQTMVLPYANGRSTTRLISVVRGMPISDGRRAGTAKESAQGGISS